MDHRKGVHHLGLATHDLDATLEFYEKVLGFQTRVCEMIHPPGGGAIRHAFIDIGQNQMLAFMEPNHVRGVPDDFDPGINKGLGIPAGIIHFAFWCDDEADLDARLQELRGRGVKVSDIVDHSWCKSIYFHDPNGIQLEYCCYCAELGPEHMAARHGSEWSGLSRE